MIHRADETSLRETRFTPLKKIFITVSYYLVLRYKPSSLQRSSELPLWATPLWDDQSIRGASEWADCQHRWCRGSRPGEVRRRISTMAVKAFCCSSVKFRKLSIFLMNCQISAFPIFVAEALTVDIPPPRVILFIYGACLGYSRRGLPEPFPAAGFHVHQSGASRSLHTASLFGFSIRLSRTRIWNLVFMLL